MSSDSSVAKTCVVAALLIVLLILIIKETNSCGVLKKKFGRKPLKRIKLATEALPKNSSTVKIPPVSLKSKPLSVARVLPKDPPQPHQRKSVYDTESRIYSTEDVDPLIVGQGYAFRDYTRDVYEGRSALGGSWGLQEFSPDSTPGAVGVDVGPYDLASYEGGVLGYSDGIPEQWAFPSTPMRQYIPQREDYTDVFGPHIANSGQLYPTFVPDHDPDLGAEEGPFPQEPV